MLSKAFRPDAFNPLSQNATFIGVENNVRKGEIACYKQFLLFSQCFLPYMALMFHFECTNGCTETDKKYGIRT